MPRIRVVMQAAPAPGMAAITLTSGGAELLANAYRDEAERARKDGRLADALVLAQRGVMLRQVAHTAEPLLNLACGDPRFPGLAGSA